MSDALQDLANLTDAIYQAELQKMAVLNQKEAEIRRKIADLETHPARQPATAFERPQRRASDRCRRPLAGMGRAHP